MRAVSDEADVGAAVEAHAEAPVQQEVGVGEARAEAAVSGVVAGGRLSVGEKAANVTAPPAAVAAGLGAPTTADGASASQRRPALGEPQHGVGDGCEIISDESSRKNSAESISDEC